VDDAGEAHERRIVGEALIYELLEGAASLSVLVRVARAGGVEAGGILIPLDSFDL
jgi:hypothetical protein